MDSLLGLRAQLESLIFSDFGRQLRSSEQGIDLFLAVQEKKIVLIFLDTRRYSSTARVLGKMLLADLKSTSARIDAEVRKVDRNPFLVVIDEFADLATEDFVSFLDRARSSRMGVVIAHQEIADLERVSPGFARRVMGNTSTLYAFLQKGPESAELISSVAGTRTVWKETMRSERWLFWDVRTGDKSLREVEEFNIHPNMVKSLGVGDCIVVKKYPNSQAYKIKVALDKMSLIKDNKRGRG